MTRDCGWLAAAVIGAGVGLAGPAAALTATTICETTGPSSANTVKVTDIGSTVTYLTFSFQRQGGSASLFPAPTGGILSSRKFPLPAGSYTMSFSTASGPTITYPQTIVVPAYQIRNGVCLMTLSPADRARVGGPR